MFDQRIAARNVTFLEIKRTQDTALLV